MSLEQNKQAALESLRVLETGDTAVAERIIAPDFINREADDPDRPDRGIRGPAGLVATSHWLREVFSELRFDQPEAVAEGERVVVTATMTEPTSGPFRVSPDAQAVSAASGSYIPDTRRTDRRAFGAA